MKFSIAHGKYSKIAHDHAHEISMAMHIGNLMPCTSDFPFAHAHEKAPKVPTGYVCCFFGGTFGVILVSNESESSILKINKHN